MQITDTAEHFCSTISCWGNSCQRANKRGRGNCIVGGKFLCRKFPDPWHAKRDKILTTISHEFVIRLVKNWWSGRVSEEKYIMEVHDCLLLADQSSGRWAHYIEIHRTKITIRQVISIVQLQVICKRPREAEPCFNWCGFYDKRENSYYYWRSRFELKLQE